MEVLCGTDVLAHLLDDEVFGAVLIEATAGSLPTITTQTGGGWEIATDGAACFLVRPGDHAGLVASLTTLLTWGSKLRRVAMGDAGRQAVWRRFFEAAQMIAVEALCCYISEPNLAAR